MSLQASAWLVAIGVLAGVPGEGRAADLLAFWDVPRNGANSFNREPPDAAYFEALAASGASWVRLAFSKWDGAGRDFLIGDADRYAGIPAADLDVLVRVLDDAHRAGLRVVVTPLSLPGARWQQQNGGKFDDRLWSERAYWDQAAVFWADLATELRAHPAVAAYNIVNEPAPERTQLLPENAPLADVRVFMSRHAGSTRDLPAFYEHVITALRLADELTPVMIDGGYFANPRHLASWPAHLSDPRVLYAFHMYEPWLATSAANLRREEPLRYPGVETEYAGTSLRWDEAAVRAHIDLAFDWADAQDLPPTRVVAAEFGCMRLWKDCGTYLGDVMEAIDGRGGHWAYYAFREDEWDGMDYELPPSFPSRRFYWLLEFGQAASMPRDGELFDIIRRRMARE